jgi:hypothetical protein
MKSPPKKEVNAVEQSSSDQLVVRSPQRGFISAESSDRRQGCLVEE